MNYVINKEMTSSTPSVITRVKHPKARNKYPAEIAIYNTLHRAAGIRSRDVVDHSNPDNKE